MGKTVAIGIRVEPETKELVDKAAAAERRSVASLFEVAMLEWLERHGYVKKAKSK